MKDRAGRVRVLRLLSTSSSRLALALLALATAFQVYHLVAGFIVPRSVRYWELRSLQAWERAALLSEGRDFLDYVAFLRETIPTNGKVVLPPHSAIDSAGPFTFVTFMQYFLFPRQVLNCSDPVEACVLGLSGPRSYLLRVGDFPPPEAASVHKDYVDFEEDKGLYVPR